MLLLFLIIKYLFQYFDCFAKASDLFFSNLNGGPLLDLDDDVYEPEPLVMAVFIHSVHCFVEVSDPYYR